MADMRTSMPTPIPDTVVLLGYYGPGDGGGGIFSWNPTSVAADDGGLVIRPEWVTGSGGWQRHFEHTVSVRWFGAFASPGQPGATVYPGPGIGNLQAFQSAIRSLTPDLSPAYYGPRIMCHLDCTRWKVHSSLIGALRSSAPAVSMP
jgi:hypothetical protein